MKIMVKIDLEEIEEIEKAYNEGLDINIQIPKKGYFKCGEHKFSPIEKYIYEEPEEFRDNVINKEKFKDVFEDYKISSEIEFIEKELNLYYEWNEFFNNKYSEKINKLEKKLKNLLKNN